MIKNIDFSRYGLKEGLLKALQVIGYVAGSGAITALIAYLSDLKLETQDATLLALITLANALLAFLQKWLTTKAPKGRKK